MLQTIQVWLQSYMDAQWSGLVNLQICDGIPGNCTLRLLDSKEISRSRCLQGCLRIRYRTRVRLLYLSNHAGSDWMEGLSSWLVAQIPEAVSLEQTGCKQTPAGIWEHTGLLTVEYDRDYPKEDV